MVRNGELSWADAKRTVRRYWWIVPLSAVLFGGIGLGSALVLPKKYTSETLVEVRQPSVGPDFVKPVVTEDLNHRLASMKEQILSRTRMQPIIDKFGLYAEERGRVQIEDLVERLRSAIEIKPMEPTPGTQSRQLPGFHVDVTFNNSNSAQKICREVTLMLLEQNSRERKQQAVETTSFLSGQLKEAKENLADQDARLAQFKRQYLGSLPEEEQSNLNILTGMNAQLEANTQALSRAHQDKAFNESLLGQQEANWKASQTRQAPETVEHQLEILQDQLASLESRYTPEHPDVIKLKNQIEEMKKRTAEEQKNKSAGNVSAPSAATQPPELQQLRARLRQDDINISDLNKRQGQIQDEIRELRTRVQASPMVEQQLKELTRNYQTAQEFYNDLLKKWQNAGVAGELENQQQSEQFLIVDPPSLPVQPSFPKKINFAGAGLGTGMALGVAILYWLAISDKALYTERDVELALKLPVLALVPMLELTADQAQFAAGRLKQN